MTIVADCDYVCGCGGVVSLSVWRRGFVTVASVCDSVCWYGSVVSLSVWSGVEVGWSGLALEWSCIGLGLDWS